MGSISSRLDSLHNNTLGGRKEGGRKGEETVLKEELFFQTVWSEAFWIYETNWRAGRWDLQGCTFSSGLEKQIVVGSTYWERKSLYLFFSLLSCHVWDYACDGLSDHLPPTDHTQLRLEPKSRQSCLSRCTAESVPALGSLCCPPSRPRMRDWPCEEWHRLCLKARRWSTCLSGTAGSTGSGGSSSASGERKRSFSR